MTGLIAGARAGLNWLQTFPGDTVDPMPELTHDQWLVAMWQNFGLRVTQSESFQAFQLDLALAVLAAGHVKWDDDIDGQRLLDYMLDWTRYGDLKGKILGEHERAV